MIDRTSRTAREIRKESAPIAEASLDSWKEIAAYLKRDVATARRWEEKEVSPIFIPPPMLNRSSPSRPEELAPPGT